MHAADDYVADLVAGISRLKVVRAHAVWAVQRLAGSEAAGLLAAVRAGETDAGVLAEHACSGGL